MSVRRRLVVFALGLAATFGAGAAIGAAVGPISVGDSDDPPVHTEHEP
jgi:hypothetical protein